MRNKAMERKLREKTALDVAPFRIENGLYRLPEGFFKDGVDYCDADREEWVWSVGKHIETGVHFASTATRFYGNPAYECVWLR